jgi:hypothetical protein
VAHKKSVDIRKWTFGVETSVSVDLLCIDIRIETQRSLPNKFSFLFVTVEHKLVELTYSK